MSEIVLSIVVLALIGFIAWREREIRLERSKFINAILAKNANELRDLEFVDKVAPTTKIIEPPNELLESELDDESFMKILKEARN